MRNVWCDATMFTIAVYDKYDKILLLRRNGEILDNEFLGIMISHILYPESVIFTDNKITARLFTRGEVPENFKSNYDFIWLMIHIYKSPIVIWER